MTYEVFSMLFRCSELHDAHSKLEDAAACFAQFTQDYGGSIPVHPVSQKYVYEIAAIDRKGNQRNFSNRERAQVDTLKLDPRSVATDIPGITTFHRLAELYYEASRLIPVSHIDLNGMFDHPDEESHFWTSDAGKGQALAYAQQAAFTLELSLKAYLEGLGKLASQSVRDIQKWHEHELVKLFNLLTGDEKKQLEEWWAHSDAKRLHYKESFQEFLSASNKLYMKWRYITDLTSPNLEIDIPILLSASEFLLSASRRQFRINSPYKVNVKMTTSPTSVDSDDGEPVPRFSNLLVEGRVREVRISEGFDPYGIVEVEIDSDHHSQPVIAQFYKRNATKYHGLQGERVALAGMVREDQPHLLPHPNHLDEPTSGPAYTSEHRMLRGSIYDIRVVHSVSGGAERVDLALYDDTYFTQVQCLFATEEERAMLSEVNLGDKVLISGLVTLLNGEPMILVAPDHIDDNVVADPEDQA